MQVKNIKDLEKYIDLTEEELSWDNSGTNTLPLLISENILNLIHIDPIRKQFVPTKHENEDTQGSLDPQEEESHTPTARLVHRYTNRAAFLVTDICFAYCRHCFRRRFSGSLVGPVNKAEILKTAKYLKEHKEIKEVLLTGGDLFTLSDEKLDELLSTLKSYREDIIYRLCTRALFSNPDRFTPELFNVIKKNNHGAPFFLMTQFNHPDEISTKTEEVLRQFSFMGIPMMNQCVLLKDVNDSTLVQVELCNKLMLNRVKPYYLFQGDLVKGTKHLRAPLSQGLKIEEEMREQLSGLAMPQYTIDLPEGGGKVILTKDHILGFDNGIWSITTPDGEIRHYPED